MFREVFSSADQVGAGPITRLNDAALSFASRFFQLESLYRSNEKYKPTWVPRLLCYDPALTVPRAALPPLGEGEYYHVDLIGLAVSTESGKAIGSVAAVENFGAGDILEIEQPDGRRFMVPVSHADIGETVTIPADYL